MDSIEVVAMFPLLGGQKCCVMGVRRVSRGADFSEFPMMGVKRLLLSVKVVLARTNGSYFE